ncbi:bifunctional diguanylate cyclase/phosphodiesterase [Methylomonas koyamae]|uniref:bifunctional diguanylate cyclase/phosphodiesterase n=2 Tax=Methylomonas koyamae TaxID=702114 RepID=UPI001C8102E1|nr:EAL domain-containing protein [Methylomonas koyamae]
MHRQRALKALRDGDFDFALQAVQRGEANISDMVEDLKIYQAELEIQNDELRQSQLQTEFSMRRFSQFFNNLPLPVLVVDLMGVIRECNSEAERRFNLRRQHLRSHFLPSLIQNQDHARLQKFFQRTQQEGQDQITQVGLKTADKLVFIGDLHGTLLEGEDQDAHEILISIIDQTQNVAQRSALDASRRHFMAYFDSSPVGMASLSPDKGWIEVNDKLCEMLGYSRQALSRMTWLEMTHPDDVESELKQFQRLLNKDLDSYQIDKRFVRQDGSILDAYIAVNAVRKVDSSLDYCVAIIEDIGRRKQAEQALLERDALLHQQSLALRERIKELRAIYAVSRLARLSQEQSGFFAELLTLIPPGMLYPEDTQIRIELQGETYQTSGANRMLSALHGQIVLDNGPSGEIIVGYDKPHDEIDHGPFFKEEQQFVDGLAELIVWFCNRLRTERERELVTKRNQALLLLTTQSHSMSEQELLNFALKQAESLTGSDIAYVHFVNFDQETLTLGAWSNNTLRYCNAIYDNHYPISRAGVWADCFRRRQTVIHNDYQALVEKRGLPDGHVKLSRHMSVPVIEAGLVVMIMGVGNKSAPYDLSDATVLEMFANNTWALLQRNRGQQMLEMHAQVFRSSREAVMITDLETRILSVNQAFTDITGYSADEVMGQSPRILKSSRHDATFYLQMWRDIKDIGYWQGEIWNRRKNGAIYPQWLGISAVKNSQGQLTGYIGVFMDITDYIQAQQRIEHLAHHDPLTGLPNRILLRDRFEQIRARSQRLDRLAAMLYLDLDHFKNINDTLGHPAGDQLLLEAARRLSFCLRDMDTVSRIGGDEFVIVLSDVNSPENMVDISQKILDTLSQPFEIEQTAFNLSCSIGISICPDDGQDFDTLLKKADTALYQAKVRGRNNYQFFTDAMNRQIARRMQLEVEMRQGLGLGQFFLCYQPQFQLDTLEVQGVEALLRWQHPSMGSVAPAEFIGVAEESGFIVDLGHFVMRQACLQAKQWLDQGRSLTVAVNVSYAQFSRNNLLGLIKACLADSGLPPQYLELELTESILVTDPDKVLTVMQELKAMGVRFSIDDFGTGYSSLSYLKRFAIDKLKIDQSFVRDVPGDPDDEAIVHAVINLARSLKISCIAEGVETEQQASFLKTLGCQEAQGYLFARPLTVDQLTTLLWKEDA